MTDGDWVDGTFAEVIAAGVTAQDETTTSRPSACQQRVLIEACTDCVVATWVACTAQWRMPQ